MRRGGFVITAFAGWLLLPQALLECRDGAGAASKLVPLVATAIQRARPLQACSQEPRSSMRSAVCRKDSGAIEVTAEWADDDDDDSNDAQLAWAVNLSLAGALYSGTVACDGSAVK